MSATTSASLGQLAVHAGLISREQCQKLRRYQVQRTRQERPISLARMLLAAGVSARKLRRLMRKNAELEVVLCDSCGEGMSQRGFKTRQEVPCSCGALVMPFRPFARAKAKAPTNLGQTHDYNQVLPIPGQPGTDRYDEVLVAPLDDLEGGPTLHFREVLDIPLRTETETLSAFRSLIQSESSGVGGEPSISSRRAPVQVEGLDLERIGPFLIEGVLGEGSVGKVYLGRHAESGGQAAVKVLRPETAEDEEYLKRFKREARAASRLDHPNLVRMIEAGYDEAKELHYIGMEYLSRGSLGEFLKHTPIVIERRALEIGRDVCSALTAASEAGIVHRDVKPHNVLFDRQGVAKLADLGMAMDLGDESRITATGVVVGTPLYIAPEQASGKDLDGRADLYALGLCLYEMLSGKQPFAEDGAPPIEIIVRHLKEELGDVRLVNPQVSDNAAQLVRGLCARDPGERYVNPSAALRDFLLVLDGHPPLGPGDAAPASALTDPTVKLKLTPDELPKVRPSEAKVAPRKPTASGGKAPLTVLLVIGAVALVATVAGLVVLLGGK
jgi:serine/threonine protein kinase